MEIPDKRLLRFILVGGICFATNLLVLYVGTEELGLHYLFSMALSILVANSLGWMLNRRWTFTDSGIQCWKEYSRYMSVSLSSTLISLGLMILLVDMLNLHYLLASATIAAAMTIVNFVLHRDWSFASSDADSTRS